MKEELNKDMKNLRKKNQTEIPEIKSSLKQKIKLKTIPAD
jgi:hypothetical protein